MKIKKIQIKNYKSVIESIEMDNFSDLHILVGPNNAGKTNLLDSIEIFFNPDNEKLKRSEGEFNLRLNLTHESEKCSLHYSGKTLDYQFSKKKYEKMKEKVIRISHSPALKKILAENLDLFKREHNEAYRDFVKTIKKYFQNIQIDEKLFEAEMSSEKEKALNRMGDGFKRLFVILFYIYNPDYEIILIDEPELHLHPSVIKKFLKILQNKNPENQIFLTTHHPTFVQAKLLDKVWRVSRNKNNSTSVCSFQKGRSIPKDRLVQEINDDNSAMLFADKVVLVEGVSDSILLRGLIDRFHNKTTDIKVVYCGGIGNIDLYEEICKIFNMPYIVMIDEDGIDRYWNKKFKNKEASKKKKKELLKSEKIFVLNGCLEENYPQKYQKKETKPLNALYAAQKIKREEYDSSLMSGIKRIVETL